MSRTDTESIKKALEQVRVEVDRWPSWMRTHETKTSASQDYSYKKLASARSKNS